MAAPLFLTCQRNASIFCGGITSPHRLDHPEGLCIDHEDGSIYCGGEAGQLYKISSDGTTMRELASTGGFALGLCLDPNGLIYLCDLIHQCVIVFDRDGNEQKRLHGVDGEEQLHIPNYPLLSADNRFLYVSDTRRSGGPGIWRFDLESGASSLWMREDCFSANGMALAPDGKSIYLVESHLPGISRIPIDSNGDPGAKETVLALPHDEPDGLAIAADGTVWISIFNPSRIYRWHPEANHLDLVIEDATTDLLHHPTNIAFRGEDELFCANLGAWHLTRIDLCPLP